MDSDEDHSDALTGMGNLTMTSEALGQKSDALELGITRILSNTEISLSC